MLIKAIHSTHPGKICIFDRLHHELLGNGMFSLILSHREIVERSKVIVDAHTVRKILVSCCRRYCSPFKIAFHHKCIRHIETAVRASIVICQRSKHAVTELSVGPATLIGVSQSHGIVNAPPCETFPLGAQAHCKIVATVTVLAPFTIHEISVVMAVIDACRPAESL